MENLENVDCNEKHKANDYLLKTFKNHRYFSEGSIVEEPQRNPPAPIHHKLQINSAKCFVLQQICHKIQQN